MERGGRVERRGEEGWWYMSRRNGRERRRIIINNKWWWTSERIRVLRIEGKEEYPNERNRDILFF